MSTLRVPDSLPSPSDDADNLRKAFVGWGTDERAIIATLAHRPPHHRRQIRHAYANAYGEDLFISLKKEISGDFERVVRLWTLDAAERDACLAEEATRKFHPKNHAVLVEIACARTSNAQFEARQEYHAQFKRSLEEDVANHTSGNFRKLLVPLVCSYRYEGEEEDMELAKSEAEVLHEHIVKKDYSHEEIIRILTTRSKAQLIATFNLYHNEFGNSINKDLKSNPKDEFLHALRSIVRCISYPERYYEKAIRIAMKGFGTDENSLTRVVTTRAEVDMKEIMDVYRKRNKEPLDRAIASETSGDYKAMLLALLGHGDV